MDLQDRAESPMYLYNRFMSFLDRHEGIQPEDNPHEHLVWLGVDMIYEVPKSGTEPELHIAIRYSKDRPVFPKRQAVRNKDAEARPLTTLVPEFVPQSK